MLYNGQLWDHKIHFQEINLCRSNQRRLESNQTHRIPCKDLTYQTLMLPAPSSSPLYSFNNHEILRGSPNTLALLKYSQETTTTKKISNRKGVSEKLSVPKASVVIVAAGEMKTVILQGVVYRAMHLYPRGFVLPPSHSADCHAWNCTLSRRFAEQRSEACMQLNLGGRKGREVWQVLKPGEGMQTISVKGIGKFLVWKLIC